MKTTLGPQLSAQQTTRSNGENLTSSCIDAVAAFLPVSLFLWALLILAGRELILLLLR